MDDNLDARIAHIEQKIKPVIENTESFRLKLNGIEVQWEKGSKWGILTISRTGFSDPKSQTQIPLVAGVKADFVVANKVATIIATIEYVWG